MRIECTECRDEIEIDRVQQFGSDITVFVTPCSCIAGIDSETEEFLREENISLKKQLASLKEDILNMLNRYGLPIECEGETDEN